jgi:predicted MFS family arabinose efflux permease
VMALVADLTREEQRTKAMAMVGMSIGLSFAVALILGPVVAAAGGLAAVFWFTALLAVIGVAIVVLLVPTPPQIGAEHADVGARAGLIGRSLRDPALARLNFGVFTLHFILMACFLVVPGFLEQSAGIDRDRHWLVYLPALLLSIAGMVPMMILAERGGRLHQVFLAAVALVFAAVSVLGFTTTPVVFYVALWVFFVGFNYLEATLPSLVSKTVFAGGKGTAMGVYSTCQFLGAFAGGAVGGWLIQHVGVAALIGVCMILSAVWWAIVRPAAQTSVVSQEQLPEA